MIKTPHILKSQSIILKIWLETDLEIVINIHGKPKTISELLFLESRSIVRFRFVPKRTELSRLEQ